MNINLRDFSKIKFCDKNVQVGEKLSKEPKVKQNK